MPGVGGVVGIVAVVVAVVLITTIEYVREESLYVTKYDRRFVGPPLGGRGVVGLISPYQNAL